MVRFTICIEDGVRVKAHHQIPRVWLEHSELSELELVAITLTSISRLAGRAAGLAPLYAKKKESP